MDNTLKEDGSYNILSSIIESDVNSFFLSVFNNNQSIMLLVDSENNQRIFDANESALKFYDYSKKEILQLHIGSLSTGSEENRYKMFSCSFQDEHKTSSGALKTVEVNISPVEYKNKKVMFIIVHNITELKATESALLESKERLELALEGSELGLWDWWIQTRAAHYNEGWAGILGYTLDELTPLSVDTWIKKIHPDDLNGVMKEIKKHFNKLTVIYKYQFRMKHKNGNWVWILGRGRVFEWSADGNPIRMSGTHLDITDRKKIEIKLLESEKRYRSYFDSSPLSLWEQDYTDVLSYLENLVESNNIGIEKLLDSQPQVVKKCADLVKILDINPATLKLYKAQSKEDLLWSLSRVFTEDSYRTFKGELIYIYNRKLIPNRESTNILLNGKIINVLVGNALLSDNRYIKTITNITDQKNIEQKLIESENTFRSYFESSPLSLWEQDYSELILYINKLKISVGADIEEYLDNNPGIVKKCSKMIRTLNVNNSSVILYESKEKKDLLLDFENIDSQASFDIFKKRIISLYRNEDTIRAETEHSTLKGNKINIRLESILLSNNKVLTTVTDITDLKNKELRLEELLAQFKSDSETKEILLREINHRVKNNISSFIGMLYAEKKQSGSAPDSVQMEHVDSLINRVKGIAIAHDLLSRSQWAAISVTKLIEKIIHSLNHLIPKDRIIDTIINQSNIFLDGDQCHSTAIIINELYLNSIEHAVRTGEKIVVEIKTEEKDGTIILTFKDSGPGYPEEILMFKFNNVGMYLIKNIVEQSLRGVMKISNKGGAFIEIEFPGGSKLEEL